MNENTYQNQVDRILDYKQKILDSSKDILSLLEEHTKNIDANNIESLLKATAHNSSKNHRENEIRTKIQEILSYLSSIGTLSDLNTKQLENILSSIHSFTEDALLQNTAIGSQAIRLVLGDINSIVFKIDKKKPFRVNLAFSSLTGTISGKFERD